MEKLKQHTDSINDGFEYFETELDSNVSMKPAYYNAPPNLPGIVILVHGVNSKGEWYEKCEEGIVKGLNERLGIKTSNSKLAPQQLKEADIAQLAINSKKEDPTRIDRTKDSRSPFIHFHWGYREPEEDKSKFEFKIPLQDRLYRSAWSNEKAKPPFYWGGGPFQNGTNNLNLLWAEKGFNRYLDKFLGIDTQKNNPEDDRQLTTAPPRTYYAHAAARLAGLIDKIRNRYPDDTISVVSHSQGTMVSMAAMFLVQTRVPDCLIVMNSPYALERKALDTMQHNQEAVTTRAREETFRNLVKKFKQNKRPLDDDLLEKLRAGVVNRNGQKSRWRPDAEGERDNHGRVYIYFSPHDRVMGSAALQSIGWQGVDKHWLDEFEDTLYQRMLARNTECGGKPGFQAFWPPGNNGEFWDGNETIFVTEVWTTPDKDKKVYINAEQVNHPVTPQEMEGFDKNRYAEGWKERAPREFHLYMDVFEPQKHEWVEEDPETTYIPDDEDPELYRKYETKEELTKRLAEYRARHTDHSSLPSHKAFLSRVVAYDLPIGPCDSFTDIAFWRELIKDADWLESDDYYFHGGLNVPAMPADIVDERVKAFHEEPEDEW